MKALIKRIVEYFVSTVIPSDSRFVETGIILSAALLVLSIIAPIALVLLKQKRPVSHEKLVRGVSNVARIAGAVWLILFFLWYEDIRPFTRPIWVYSIIPFALVAVTVIILKYRQTLPVRQKETVLQQRYDKYLPKPKAK